jgi:hypothetical protein
MGLPEYVLSDILVCLFYFFRSFCVSFLRLFLRSVHLSRPLPCILYITHFGILFILNVGYQSIARTAGCLDVVHTVNTYNKLEEQQGRQYST